MSLKNIIVAALVAAPFALVPASLQAKDADKATGSVERIAHIADSIHHLLTIRKELVEDMRHADTEDAALESAQNIAHVDDAITTLHAVEHMHDAAAKGKN